MEIIHDDWHYTIYDTSTSWKGVYCYVKDTNNSDLPFWADLYNYTIDPWSLPSVDAALGYYYSVIKSNPSPTVFMVLLYHNGLYFAITYTLLVNIIDFRYEKDGQKRHLYMYDKIYTYKEGSPQKLWLDYQQGSFGESYHWTRTSTYYDTSGDEIIKSSLYVLDRRFNLLWRGIGYSYEYFMTNILYEIWGINTPDVYPYPRGWAIAFPYDTSHDMYGTWQKFLPQTNYSWNIEGINYTAGGAST